MERRNFLKLLFSLPAIPLLANKEPSLELIHVTDSHMDLSMPHTVEALEHFVDVINRDFAHVDCVLFGGDNFNNTAPGLKDGVRFKEILDGLKVPYYCVRGNKESSPKPDPHLDQRDFARLFFGPGMEVHGRDWVVYKKGYAIVGIDSTIEHSGAGRFGPQSVALLKRVLARGMPTIILDHHPLHNYWGGSGADLKKYLLQNADEVKRELFGYPNLVLVLSGHKHIDNVTQEGHVTLIATRAFKEAQIKNRNPIRHIRIEGGRVYQRLMTT